MTNYLTSTSDSTRPASTGWADRRTRRPVKLVEHPAFRGRRERDARAATPRAPVSIRVVLLHDAAWPDSRPRTAMTSTLATSSVPEAA